MESGAKITVRLPADLHSALVEQARLDERSLNSEIIYLLRQALWPTVNADAYQGARGALQPAPQQAFPRPAARKPRGSR